VPFRETKARAYFAALRDELRLYHAAGHAFTSLYVGGGTPTCAAGELVETIGLARELFGVTEISVETTPIDLRPDVIERLAAAGVTRLSVGVQSFDDRLLAAMGRLTTYGSSEAIVERLDAAAAAFPTLNVDLMYNLPHQDAASLEHDLDVVLGLRANQLALYPLMTAHTAEARIRATMGAAVASCASTTATSPGCAGVRAAVLLVLPAPGRLDESWSTPTTTSASGGRPSPRRHLYATTSRSTTTWTWSAAARRITGAALLDPRPARNVFLAGLFGLELAAGSAPAGAAASSASCGGSWRPCGRSGRWQRTTSRGGSAIAGCTSGS
jgi:hypothetical protein